MELEELYAQLHPRIYAFFFVKTMDREAAEDLTHETFYEALKSAASYQGKSTLPTWLFAIAKNRLKKYYRAKQYKAGLNERLSREQAASASPEEQVIRKETYSRLVEKINELEDAVKEIVILRIYGELSFKEIGELLGRSDNYARVTFHRAKLHLHKELEGDYGQ